MARKPDWLDFAHQLHKERVAIAEQLPPGIECSLTLSAYSFSDGARFSVHLTHRESDLAGHGSGSTPAKALEGAVKDLAANRNKRPQLVVGGEKAKALPPARKGGEA